MRRKTEKPHPLGDRVYEKHDAMIVRMARKKSIAEGRKVSRGEIVREAIEEKFYKDV